jgi:hypothetical protein
VVRKRARESSVDILLSALQVILAIKVGSLAVTHGPGRYRAAMSKARQRFGPAADLVLTLVAMASVLAAAGLLLPAVTTTPVWLTPATATVGAVMMLLATVLHWRARESPNARGTLILFAMATVLAFGRWAIVPLGS